MVTLPCAKPPRNKDSSSRQRRSRPKAGSSLCNQRRSNLDHALGAVEDSCQLICVFAFTIEGAADRSEGFRERENIMRHKQIVIFSSDRVPVHTLSSNRDF